MSKNLTTARGEQLNMDALVTTANRPANYRDPAAQIVPVETPKASAALNIRGHMPAQGTPAPHIPGSAEDRHVHPVSEVAPPVGLPVDNRSMAELTGIRIDRARTIKVKPGATVKPGDGAALAEETVSWATSTMQPAQGAAGNVLDDLD